jgi:hypothetical protein
MCAAWTANAFQQFSRNRVIICFVVLERRFPAILATSSEGVTMGKLLHTSKVKIQKEPGNSKIKRAQVEGFPDVLRMGIHGGI